MGDETSFLATWRAWVCMMVRGQNKMGISCRISPQDQTNCVGQKGNGETNSPKALIRHLSDRPSAVFGMCMYIGENIKRIRHLSC